MADTNTMADTNIPNTMADTNIPNTMADTNLPNTMADTNLPSTTAAKMCIENKNNSMQEKCLRNLIRATRVYVLLL